MTTLTKTSFFSLTFDQFQQRVNELGLRTYVAIQVFDWIYRKLELDQSKWLNISKKDKIVLENHYSFSLPKILWNGMSKDGTQKILFKLEDGQSIESVIIPGKDRLTLCISSQVGCAMGCHFCHTATQGLKRHLEIHEVVGQFMAANLILAEKKSTIHSRERLTNIVYMGQGEPLHNFERMKVATEIFLDQKGIGLGQRKITLSTSGLAPQIERLKDFPPINLAISLHSPRDEVRTSLMPINKTYNLERLFQAIKSVPLKGHRRITYEYLLISELTDTQEDMDLLAKLLERSESKINLIPFNEFPGSVYKRPSEEQILWFMDGLIKKGFTCTIRATKGKDILAACGQLKSEYEKVNLWPKNTNPSKEELVSLIHDGVE